MTEHDTRISELAKAFSHAATDLGEALLAKLTAVQPEMAAEIAYAVEHGQRMQMRLEWDLAHPKIEWVTIDDYERMSVIMSVVAPPLTPQ